MPSDVPIAGLPLPEVAAVPDTCKVPREESVERDVVVLFDRMRDRLLRYVLTMQLGVSDGEEVVQDTFLALYEHLSAGRSQQNLNAWLFRVAHNFALKRLRKFGPAFQSLTGSVEDVLDPGRDPEAELMRNRSQRAVESIIRALPEQDRRCLLLRTEGLRYREIADVLGISLGTVSLSITRSIEKISRAVVR